MSQSTFDETFDKTLGFGVAALAVVGIGYAVPKGLTWVWENSGEFVQWLADNAATPASQVFAPPTARIAPPSFVPEKCGKCGKPRFGKCFSIECYPEGYSYCAVHSMRYSRLSLCHRCNPQKKRGRRKSNLRALPAKRVSEQKLIEATPPLLELQAASEPSPVPVAEHQKPKKNNRGRQLGSRGVRTQKRLDAYTLFRNRGESDELARIHAVQHIFRGQENLPTRKVKKEREALDKAVKKYLDDGQNWKI